ncbi:PIG-X [Scheffersomyces xylosifermentans]|uniref:PIG-X n=1 Tax=Scheffersomyces xylosifermentans TaxID=1304137 RepID=UPI00315CDA53
MIRQRTTIFNPTKTHDDIVQNIDKSSFSIKPSTDKFLIENKFTIPVSVSDPFGKYKRIESLRIQTTDDSFKEDTIFNYRFSSGVNIYVVPKTVESNEDREEFYQEVEQLVSELLPIEVKKDNWIKVLNSLHFHDYLPRELNVDILRLGGSEELFKSKNYDLFYEAGTGVILKQLGLAWPEINIGLNETIHKEIGLFLTDEISSPEDIVLSGVRVIISVEQDEENIFKTFFHVKPRHRYSQQEINSHIVDNGLHPILRTTFHGVGLPQDIDVKECNLYYYLSLNKSLIFDIYQSVPQGAELVLNYGSKDLELPEYKIDEWGNEILFEFSNASAPHHIDFTLHSRYQLPNNESEVTEVLNSLPRLFYGCNVKDDYLLDKSPFDTKLKYGGNYEPYFTNDTVFYHLNHDDQSKVLVHVPNGTSSFDRVNTISTIAVLFGTFIVLVQILRAVLKTKAKAVDVNKKTQ